MIIEMAECNVSLKLNLYINDNYYLNLTMVQTTTRGKQYSLLFLFLCANITKHGCEIVGLIDETGREYDLEKLELLDNSGTEADVYKVDSDKILKVTKSLGPIRTSFLNVVDELRSGGYSFLAEIISLVKYNDKVCGNLSIRYTHDNNLLLMSIDDLLASISKLENDVDKLSNKKIIFEDVLDSYNCFVSNGQFVVVDYWDFFEDLSKSLEEIKKQNRNRLKNLINYMLLEECKSAVLTDFLHAIYHQIDLSKPIEPQFEKQFSKIHTSLYEHFR